MKCFLFGAVIALVALPAFADPALRPQPNPTCAATATPPSDASTGSSPRPSPEFTPAQLQVIYVALHDAGAACDAGVKHYCLVAAQRDEAVATVIALMQQQQKPPK
jgi:hypothetical protein